MKPRPTDDDLDALLMRTRRQTEGVPPGLRELIHGASFEWRPEPAPRAFAVVALSACVLILATAVAPAVAMAVATLWWLVPIAGFGWVALKPDS